MKRPITALLATAAMLAPVGALPTRALADAPSSAAGALIQTHRACRVTPDLIEKMAVLMRTTPQAAAQMINQMIGMRLPAMVEIMRTMGMTPREIAQCIVLMARAGCL